MGATGGRLLELAGDAEVDPRTQQALVSMAKSVASATAALVTNARNVAAKCDDQALQNQVILSAKQTALATQGLIACTKVGYYIQVSLFSICYLGILHPPPTHTHTHTRTHTHTGLISVKV